MAPLLARNQLAALDLPLGLTARDRSEDEATQLVHATPAYLAERYGLQGAGELQRLGGTRGPLTRGTGGEPLRPTTLVLVSSPRLAAALLRRQSTVAVDLPQRIVVYETAGSRTRLAHANPAYTARRHRVTGEDGAVGRLSELMEELSPAAAR